MQAALEQVRRPQLTSDGVSQLSGSLLGLKGKLRSFEENLISGMLLKLLALVLVFGEYEVHFQRYALGGKLKLLADKSTYPESI